MHDDVDVDDDERAKMNCRRERFRRLTRLNSPQLERQRRRRRPRRRDDVYPL